MAVRQYIGARYVPKFFDWDGSPEWRSGVEYEALTIVTRNGNSYTSKIPVPSNIGAPESNPHYWVATGMYNEQVEAYRRMVIALTDRVSDAEINLSEETANRISGDDALSDDINAETEARTNADSLLNAKVDKLENLVGKDTAPVKSFIGAFDGDSANVQGCYSIGNTIYVYKSSGPIGSFKTIDMTTGAMSGYGSSVGFYHGNDFCVKNNRLYCAPYDNGSQGVNKIIVGNVDGSAVIEEIDCFSGTGLDCLYGITDYEGDEILCALRPYGSLYDVTATRLFAFNVNTRAIREIAINWNGFYYGLNSFPHPIIYIDGVLYLTTSFENGIYSIIINDNTAKVVHYDGLDYDNNINIPMSEIEGICTVDRFGKNLLIILGKNNDMDSVIIDGICLSGTYSNYIFNNNFTQTNQFREVSYDPSSTNVFEDGTAERPFKKIKRAICACHSSMISPVSAVTIRMPSVCNENIMLPNSRYGFAGACTFNGSVELIRCDATFSENCVFNGEVKVRVSSNFTCKNATIHDITISDGSKATLSLAKITGTITINDSQVRIGLADATADINGNCYGNSLLQLNRTKPNSLNIGGGTTLLTPGIK